MTPLILLQRDHPTYSGDHTLEDRGHPDPLRTVGHKIRGDADNWGPES